MWVRLLSLLAISSLLSACAGLPVVTDYDPERDLSHYQRYAWIADDKITRHLMVDTALVDKRVRRAVEDNLNSLGFSKTDEADAQFLVAYHYDVKDKLYVDSYYSFGGYYPWWSNHHHFGPHAGFNDIDVRQYEQGILIIDLIDKADNKLFWRGVSERRLRKGLSPAERDADVSEIVAAILARYPR